MSDLRDQTHKPAVTAEERTFLEYHENTPWARAMVARGLRLNPEALAYMQGEIDARALRKKLYDEQIAKDRAAANGAGENNEQRPPGEGSGSPGESAGAGEVQQGAGADLPADSATRPAAGSV